MGEDVGSKTSATETPYPLTEHRRTCFRWSLTTYRGYHMRRRDSVPWKGQRQLPYLYHRALKESQNPAVLLTPVQHKGQWVIDEILFVYCFAVDELLAQIFSALLDALVFLPR
jgi:hypothetical protein